MNLGFRRSGICSLNHKYSSWSCLEISLEIATQSDEKVGYLVVDRVLNHRLSSIVALVVQSIP